MGTEVFYCFIGNFVEFSYKDKKKRGEVIMNTLVIVLIAAVVLVAAYVFYGRWLANKWGIDPKAETPAVKFKDGKETMVT